MKLKARFITLALLAAGYGDGTTAEDAATERPSHPCGGKGAPPKTRR